MKALLAASLGVRQPQPVQLAALEVLAKFDSADVPAIVLAQWPAMSPRIRATATSGSDDTGFRLGAPSEDQQCTCDGGEAVHGTLL